MRLKAVIFDWAGTTVDFGSQCPVKAFKAAFAARGVMVTSELIHRFMGLKKRDHINATLEMPEVTAAWLQANKTQPTAKDTDDVYRVSEKLLLESVAKFAEPNPFLAEAVSAIRAMGLKIGSTSGYTAAMLERLSAAARLKGYTPDCWVGADEVPEARPAPWMIFRNMEKLNVWPPCTVVKIGDTVADVAEGLNAGVWTVAILESSSMVGRTQEELEALKPKTRNLIYRKVRKQYAEAGAHFIIANLSELEAVLEKIGSHLERGMMPPRLKRRSSVLSRNFLL